MKWNFKSFLHYLIISTFLVCGLGLSQTPFNGLVLEQLDNGGAVEGTTYRIYAELSEGKLYAIYGDELNPSLLETTESFFNDALYGGHWNFQDEVIEGAFDDNPTIEWDTWVTIGDTYDDAVQTIGELNILNFSTSSWLFGGLVNSDATIFRTPDNANCLPLREPS